MSELKGSTALQIRKAVTRSQEPFLTVTELAEVLDVTRRTVRNNVEEAISHPGIESKRVDRTTVLYSKEVFEWQPTHHLISSEIDSPLRRSIVANRAEWLDAKERYYYSFSGNLELPHRIRHYYALIDYAIGCGGPYYSPDAEGECVIRVEKDAPVSEKDVRYFDREIYLFDAPWTEGIEHNPDEIEDVVRGEVNGISGLLLFNRKLAVSIADLIEETPNVQASDGEYDLMDLPESEIDRLFPTAADIVHAGSIIDEFTKKLHGIGW